MEETSGPIIANGKIISGRGCEFKATPNGCVITAHDAKTGKEIGAPAPFRGRANPETRPGAAFRKRIVAMWAHGWCLASIPN